MATKKRTSMTISPEVFDNLTRKLRDTKYSNSSFIEEAIVFYYKHKSGEDLVDGYVFSNKTLDEDDSSDENDVDEVDPVDAIMQSALS